MQVCLVQICCQFVDCYKYDKLSVEYVIINFSPEQIQNGTQGQLAPLSKCGKQSKV